MWKCVPLVCNVVLCWACVQSTHNGLQLRPFDLSNRMRNIQFDERRATTIVYLVCVWGFDAFTHSLEIICVIIINNNAHESERLWPSPIHGVIDNINDENGDNAVNDFIMRLFFWKMNLLSAPKWYIVSCRILIVSDSLPTQRQNW